MTKYHVFIGNYGSGKTELSLHFARAAAKRKQKTLLIDLDIVNPYFRSGEKRQPLEKEGIRVILPPYACSNVDMPVVPADVASAFSGIYDTVIFDVGGDAVGAAALGQYYHFFEKEKNATQVYHVVNTKRPLSDSEERITTLLSEIQAASRLSVTGWIHNSNLAAETTLETILSGAKLLYHISQHTGIPIAYTAAMPEIMREFKKEALPLEMTGRYISLSPCMRPSWLDKT